MPCMPEDKTSRQWRIQRNDRITPTRAAMSQRRYGSDGHGRADSEANARHALVPTWPRQPIGAVSSRIVTIDGSTGRSVLAVGWTRKVDRARSSIPALVHERVSVGARHAQMLVGGYVRSSTSNVDGGSYCCGYSSQTVSCLQAMVVCGHARTAWRRDGELTCRVPFEWRATGGRNMGSSPVKSQLGCTPVM